MGITLKSGKCVFDRKKMGSSRSLPSTKLTMRLFIEKNLGCSSDAGV
jgi:hypothetical protein